MKQGTYYQMQMLLLHPRVPEGHYPFGELAGVGVAFKLAHALYGEVTGSFI